MEVNAFTLYLWSNAFTVDGAVYPFPFVVYGGVHYLLRVTVEVNHFVLFGARSDLS